MVQPGTVGLLCPKIENTAANNAYGPSVVVAMSAPTTSAMGNPQIGMFALPLQQHKQQCGGSGPGGQLDPSLMERSGSLSSISDLHLQQSSSTPYPSTQPATSLGQSSSAGSGNGPLNCTVCGDAATGRHYGSVACNGCKGFFRRTIRRNYKYTCRFNSNCQIDRHNRAVCRACRYARCIQFGMKVDAVQSERDLIGKRSRYSSTPGLLSGGGPGSAAASPPQQQNAEEGQQQHKNSFKLVPEQQPQQNQMEQPHFDSIPSCSSSASAPSQPCTQPPSSSFMSQSQFANSLDNEDPVPRKRSFSSGSRFEQMVQIGRRQFAAVQAANKAEQQQQQAEEAADPWSGRNSKALLRQLLCSEEKIRNMREAVVAQTCNLEYTTKGEPNRHMPAQMRVGGGNGTTRKANENDILQSLHSQLLLVIEWAKTLKPFADLPTEDQTNLLKNFAAQHVVLCVAYRSTSDFLKLINDSCIPRIANGDDKDLFYRKDAERVMDLLVSPMRFLRIDDVEFVAMKACILFNPVARGLSAPSVMSVLQTRRHIFRALQQYIQTKMPPDEDRIGDLTFFILSPLQSLAKAVSEDVLVSKLSGVARLDQLMEELILEDSDPKETMDSASGSEEQLQQQHVIVSQQSQEGMGMGGQGATESNASVAGQLFLAAAAALGNSPPMANSSQWSGPNSPPQESRGGGMGAPNNNPINFIMCPTTGGMPQQRSRHLSSSASSSSNSPPMALLQPVPPTPYPGQQRAPIGPLSPINESELSSSALSRYVFGGTLHGTPQFAFVPSSTTGAPSSSALPQAIASSSGGQDVLLSAAASHPMSPPSSSSAQFRSSPQRDRHHPTVAASNRSEFWPSPVGSNLLFTPSTPGAAIYSGTSPSPPQPFGIGGSNG